MKAAEAEEGTSSRVQGATSDELDHLNSRVKFYFPLSNENGSSVAFPKSEGI